MISFFTSVTNFFSSLWETIQLIFQCIKQIVIFLGNILGFVTDVFSSVPVYISVSLILVVSLLIVYKILGR